MTTMPFDNHPLTRKRLQFVGIGVNKLTLKIIDIIQSSSNYNIASSFIYWNQNIVHMKILDTSFKMTKIRFRFRRYCVVREKNEIRVSIILKILIFHSFKASGSTFSRLHQRLLNSFNCMIIMRVCSLMPGKGLASWLSFVMSNCEVFTLPLVSWVRYGA